MNRFERIESALILGALGCAGGMVYLLFATPARSEVPTPLLTQMSAHNCFDTKELETDLLARFNEIPQGAGLTNKGYLLRRFASLKNNTYTLVVTQPSGLSCVVEMGTDWQESPKEIAGDKT